MVTLLLTALLSLTPAKKLTPAEKPAPDSVRVLFIYGSYPAKGYKKTERKWFGGIYGGHVGLEIAPDSVLGFRSTEYPCHFFPHRRFSSIWEIKTLYRMWETFPPHNYKVEELKRVVFTIPVTKTQKHKIDSLAIRYLKKTPYDYATAGMRCASATYDILAKSGLFKEYGSSTWWKILTPKDLRTILFKKARSPEGESWKVYQYPGSKRRVWENDSQ
jgi:hypothetical protein